MQGLGVVNASRDAFGRKMSAQGIPALGSNYVEMADAFGVRHYRTYSFAAGQGLVIERSQTAAIVVPFVELSQECA
jgi:hypothetical protein